VAARTAVAAGVVALAAAAPAALALAGAPSSIRADRLQEVRVCGAGALDRAAGTCKRDQSRSPIVSSAFNCSARARGEAGERFAGRFLYEGSAFQAFGASLTDRRRGMYIYLTAGPNPMPGGRWACELRAGPERVRKAFRSAGPTGPILYVAACLTSRTVPAGPARVCRRDESGTTFRPTDTITCSALLVGGKGKLAGIEFLREGKQTGLSQDFELPLPVVAAGPRLEPAPSLATGRWTCRWTLAGRVLATKQFRIS
jgi:hypothetical protein